MKTFAFLALGFCIALSGEPLADRADTDTARPQMAEITVAAAQPSPCKGLTNDVCLKTSECGWVKSFKTKKGKVINAFCRKKGGFTKKATATVPAPKN